MFSIQDSLSNLTITINHPGYQTRKVNIYSGVAADIIIEKEAILLEEAIVKAFNQNRTVNNISASVSLLGKHELELFSTSSFVPAFNTAPGVKMDERSPGSYRLSIRGNLLRSTFGVRNVKVYWNGIPFSDASGNTYFNELSTSNINSIEIIKGPSGSLYGSGTGGVLLMNSFDRGAASKQLSIQSSVGTYGNLSSGINYKQAGNFSQAISLSRDENDGYRVQSAMRRSVASYAAGYDLSPAYHLNLNVFYSDLYYQTPGGLTIAEVKKDPRQARPAAGTSLSAVAQMAALHLKTTYTGIGHEWKFLPHWQNTTGFYLSYTDFRNPTIRNYERKYENGSGARTNFQFKKNGIVINFGSEYQSGFINTSVHGNKKGIKDTLQYHDEIKPRQFNAFFQAEINLGSKVILNTGISYNKFYYGYSRVNTPTLKDASSFNAQWIPRLSLLYKTSFLNYYISASKGYSPPSIDEIHASNGIFNKTLQAENAVNYEIGTKGTIAHGKLGIAVSYYQMRLQNTIVSRRDSSGADYYVNSGETKQHGLETAITFRPISRETGVIRKLLFSLNLTVTNARFLHYQQGVNKFDGNKLTGTPSEVLSAGIEFKTFLGLYLNSQYNYTGKIPLNDANSFFSARYNLLFLKAGRVFKILKSINADAYIGYDYSFNNPYSLGNDLNAAANRYYNPSPPQNLRVGVKLNYILK